MALLSNTNTVREMGSGQPFKQFALDYFDRGWLPLPLPPGEKSPPPKGYTGHYESPTLEVIERWIEEQPDRSNIGLRVPDGIIGVDIDAYKGKQGGASFGALTEALGVLPPTWSLSARADGLSGIRFFRVPFGKHWPGELAPDIQVIQYRHRYSVAYPSLHPKLHKMYRWYPPGAHINGTDWSSEIPDISGLTVLGSGWPESE